MITFLLPLILFHSRGSDTPARLHVYTNASGSEGELGLWLKNESAENMQSIFDWEWCPIQSLAHKEMAELDNECLVISWSNE